MKYHKVHISSDLQKLFPRFLDNRKNNLVEIAQALSRDDLQEVENIAHKIKGNCGTFGLPMMSEWGRDMETAAKNNNHEQIKELLQRMEEYLNNLEYDFV